MDKNNFSKRYGDQRYKDKQDAEIRCLGAIKKFVQSEVAKGKTVEEAIKTVISNPTIQKIYPQINDEKVRKNVLKNIRLIYYGSGSEYQFGIKEDKLKDSDR